MENMKHDENEIIIDFKKIAFILWDKKILIIRMLILVLTFFIFLTFITEKQWKVDAELYINKSNNSNLMEVNPYAIEEASSITSMLRDVNPLANELELLKSSLVIDKVIKDNNLKYKKLFGIIPTKKMGEYWTTDKFLKKKTSFENKKGTYVISISYTSKDREEAYNVVSSIITHYIALHKELNSEKSKSDKRIIESEYNKVKADLNKKVGSASGLPSSSLSGTGNLAAMGAFSRSAQNAMSTLQGQYIAGEKARVAISEDEAKVSQLAQKLEWARLVEEMSDSSKVLIIKEPTIPRDWEYASPSLIINILLGIVFGVIGSVLAVVIVELRDKKLTYSMLGDNIIYNPELELNSLKKVLISNNDKNISIIAFDEISGSVMQELAKYRNLNYTKADLSEKFIDDIKNSELVILFVSVGNTDSQLYNTIKEILADKNKEILTEVLV